MVIVIIGAILIAGGLALAEWGVSSMIRDKAFRASAVRVTATVLKVRKLAFGRAMCTCGVQLPGHANACVESAAYWQGRELAAVGDVVEVLVVEHPEGKYLLDVCDPEFMKGWPDLHTVAAIVGAVACVAAGVVLIVVS